MIEVDAQMVLQYRITLKWKDSRVKFRNLKHDAFLNTVGTDDAAKIWYPKVVFYNTREKEKTEVTDSCISFPEKMTYLFNTFLFSTTKNHLLPFSRMEIQPSALLKKSKMTIFIWDLKMSSFLFRTIQLVSYAIMIWQPIHLTNKSAV